MNIIPSYNNKLIHGVVVKNENYYVIRHKETQEFDCNDGELTMNIMKANWYSTYQEAKEMLKHFDEPGMFEIIRFSCTTTLEEVM